MSHLVAPIVTIGRKLSPSIGRKLSRRENPEDYKLGTVISEHVRELSIQLDSDLDISDEYISQMKEVFKEYDKVKTISICLGRICPGGLVIQHTQPTSILDSSLSEKAFYRNINRTTVGRFARRSLGPC